MPAYNYKVRFSVLVEEGLKTQTIRKKRKRPTKEGDTLYHYVGMRTKKCRKLLESICEGVAAVEIGVGGICTDGKMMLIGSPNADIFAEDDGFDNSEEMIQWFKETHGLPFKGEVIYW